MAGRRIALLAALALTGCSALFIRRPDASDPHPTCTLSGVLPAVDVTLALLSGVGGVAAAIQEQQHRTVLVVPNLIDFVIFTLSARYGFQATRQCRSSIEDRRRAEEEEEEKQAQTFNDCGELLPLLVDGSPFDLAPLADGCDLDTARAHLPGLARDATTEIQGVGSVRAVLAVDGARAGAVVRLWFDAERMTMIEIVSPADAEPWPRLQARIGIPELTAGHQRAYPSHGMAFVVSDDEQVVDEILLFVPTTSEDYAWSYALPE